jgi:molybdopterin converting factor small subunit
MRLEGYKVHIIMGKVQLKIPPFFAYIMDPGASDWFVLEREIGKETTIRDLLTNIAFTNAEFRKAVFNPAEETISDRINIVLNQKLLNLPSEMDTKLNDGDVVTLLPMYSGG